MVTYRQYQGLSNALQCITFFKESSSFMVEPSVATACLPLRFAAGVASGADLGNGGGVWNPTSLEKDSSAFAIR
jgi:hypothetical protein